MVIKRACAEITSSDCIILFSSLRITHSGKEANGKLIPWFLLHGTTDGIYAVNQSSTERIKNYSNKI